MRTGVVAKKLGISRHFAEDGRAVPVTLLQLENCQVVGVRTEEKDGYNAVAIGAGVRKEKNVNKAQRAQANKAGVAVNAKIAEFRTTADNLLNVGDKISASHFVAGQKVDVTGTSKGKGFAGGMKRWNFGGLEATHGISISHRSHGSTGQCQDPGRVFKGKKMAGQLGNVKKTMQNLEVIGSDEENNIVYVKGSVPGANGGYVLLKDAVKRQLPENVPFPAGLVQDEKAAAKAEEAPAVEAATEAPAEAAEGESNES